MSAPNQIDLLLEEAESLDDGLVKVQLIEEAVRLADLHGDLDRCFQARRVLLGAAHMAGLPEQMLVAYSWCLAQSDREPERFEERQLLWRYRWVINQLPRFPQISKEQIDGAIEDMTRRYHQAGSTLRAVHLLTRLVAIQMGARERAARAHQALLRALRDWLSDSPAAEQDFLVWYFIWSGQDSEGLTAAEPLLAGRWGDSYVPEQVYSELLLPLLRLRQPEKAMAYHLKGYRLIARKSPFRNLGNLSDHLVFLALTLNLSRAVKLFEKTLPVALASSSLSERFDNYLAGRTLLDRLQEQDKTELKLRLPATFPLHDARGRYPVAELTDWLMKELRDLADRFDARNGNGYFKERVAEVETHKKLIAPLPVPVRGQ